MVDCLHSHFEAFCLDVSLFPIIIKITTIQLCFIKAKPTCLFQWGTHYNSTESFFNRLTNQRWPFHSS